MLKDQEYKNNSELKDFIKIHDLKNRYSIVHFNAKVLIETNKNKYKGEMEIRITFDDLGNLVLLDDDLDPFIYPTEFNANWQIFQHIDEIYLLITGKHNSNAEIGEYEVKIIPLGKLRD